MRGLAFRQQQWQRARGRAFLHLRWIWSYDPSWVTAKAIARRAIHRTPCSCSMCGNPRRYTGEVTRQETLARNGCEGFDVER